MIDLRDPLAVLAQRLPWGQIEEALAPKFKRKDRECGVRSLTRAECGVRSLKLTPRPNLVLKLNIAGSGL